jgi:hypothetical protein
LTVNAMAILSSLLPDRVCGRPPVCKNNFE